MGDITVTNSDGSEYTISGNDNQAGTSGRISAENTKALIDLDPKTYSLTATKTTRTDKWLGGRQLYTFNRGYISQHPTRSRTMVYPTTTTSSTSTGGSVSLTSSLIIAELAYQQQQFKLPDYFTSVPGGIVEGSFYILEWVNGSYDSLSPVGGPRYEAFMPTYCYQHLSGKLSLDLTDLATNMRTNYPNTENYLIAGYSWSISINGKKYVLFSKTYEDGRTLSTLDNVPNNFQLNNQQILTAINKAYKTGSGTLEIDPQDFGIQFTKTPSGYAAVTKGTLISETGFLGANKVWTYSDSITVPLSITVWMALSTTKEVPAIQTAGDEDKGPQEEDNKDYSLVSGVDGSIPSTKIGGNTDNNKKPNSPDGGADNGIREVRGGFENLVSYFPSVVLDPDILDDMIESGGGIVGTGGIWKNGTNGLYIENIKLSVSGNSAIIVQATTFDTTPYLNVGDRLFIYYDSAQPQFAGYVEAISRRINEGRTEIVFTCSDIKKLISEGTTPLIYKASKKSINQIATDLLLSAGAMQRINNLPFTKVSVDYQADQLGGALDYLCSVGGEYTWWCDKNGRIHLDHLRRGSTHTFAMPTAGTPITPASNLIASVDCNTDLSLSKSKIVIIGGSGFKIYTSSAYFTANSLLKSTPTTHNSIEDFLDKYQSGIVYIPNSNNDYDIYCVKTIVNAEALSEYPSKNRPLQAVESASLYASSNQIVNSTKTQYTVSSRTSINSSGKSVAQFWVGPLSTAATTNLKSTWYTTPSTRTVKDPDTGKEETEEYSDWHEVVKLNTKMSIRLELAYRNLGQPFFKSINTGYPGGILTIKDTGFEYISNNVDDSNLMLDMANSLSNYYKPFICGSISLHDIQTDLNVGDRITITGTDLAASLSDNLPIWSIDYDFINRLTNVEISTRSSPGGLTIDSSILKNNRKYSVDAFGQQRDRFVIRKFTK